MAGRPAQELSREPMLGIDLKEEQMIEARGSHETLRPDELSFTVRPGVVTGFPCPNGSGSRPTMQIIVGLDAPDAACRGLWRKKGS
jgi:ABC-type multidrug transport system ATPase subunit